MRMRRRIKLFVLSRQAEFKASYAAVPDSSRNSGFAM
jgi:hypothetical protein